MTCQAPNCTNKRDLKQRSSLCVMHRVRRSRHKSFDLPEKNKSVAKICKHHGELTEENIYKVRGKEWKNCKLCKKESYLKFKEKNPSYKPTRNFMFIGNKGNIKFPVKEYEKLYEQQQGLCKICTKPETMVNAWNKSKPKRLALDHCHKTGKIRGLLCHRCNTGIGGFYESIEILEAAIAYLKSHQ